MFFLNHQATSVGATRSFHPQLKVPFASAVGFEEYGMLSWSCLCVHSLLVLPKIAHSFPPTPITISTPFYFIFPSIILSYHLIAYSLRSPLSLFSSLFSRPPSLRVTYRTKHSPSFLCILPSCPCRQLLRKQLNLVKFSLLLQKLHLPILD